MPRPAPQGDRFAPPRASSSAAFGWLAALALVAAGVAGWWFWWRPAHMAPPPAVASTPAADVAAPPAVPEPPLHHPIEPLAEQEAPAAPGDADQQLQAGLAQLLGARQVATFLQLDGFARRAVATVDNLARPQASARLWPVQPTPGRFTVDGPADAHTQTIAADNAGRYRAFVAFAEGVPVDAAVRLYARLYPLFQAEYVELGYPNGYFNDRLVQVLDHLLATPEPAGPLAVQLTPVEGEVPSLQPWVRYEFADPQLQALSSGQKLLLRMGPDNARRLKVVLRQVRQRVATGVKAPG